MLGLITFNAAKNVYQIAAENNPHKVLTKSKHGHHLAYLVRRQRNEEIVAAGVTEFQFVSIRPGETDPEVLAAVGGTAFAPAPSVTSTIFTPAIPVPSIPKLDDFFTLDEKFSLMEEAIDMCIERKAKGVMVAGKGGIGKTHSVMARFKAAGKIDAVEVTPSIEDLMAEEIKPEDDEEAIKEKALKTMNRPQGDYVVIKGNATPKALYRILFENRKRHIIFDDCDSILMDRVCANLLKAGLDTYADTYISWRSEGLMDDLPQSFKFEGAIVFITNLDLDEIDPAFATRCHPIELSMTPEQRIQRMRSVLGNVMPEVDLELKEEAISVMEENMQYAADKVNFRKLMQLIEIRVSSPNWKLMAKYSMLVGSLK